MNYQANQIIIGQSKIEFSARMYESMAKDFEFLDSGRATACREMAQITRGWKTDDKICLRFANNNKLGVA